MPITLPNNVLETFCGFHEVFLEHFWLGVCLVLSHWIYVLSTLLLFLEHFWVLRIFRGRTIGMPGRLVPAQALSRGHARVDTVLVWGAFLGSTWRSCSTLGRLAFEP
eukprot:6701667-Pyramimonas_sp.AAC.1